MSTKFLFLFLYFSVILFLHNFTPYRNGCSRARSGNRNGRCLCCKLKSILNRHSINNRRNKISGKGIACCCRINSFYLKDSPDGKFLFHPDIRNHRPQVSERLLPLDKVLSLSQEFCQVLFSGNLESFDLIHQEKTYLRQITFFKCTVKR